MDYIFILRQQRRSRRDQMRILRRRLRDGSNPFESTTETEFIKLFRLSKDICHDFVNRVGINITERPGGRPHALPPLLRILTALRFLATGSYQRSIGQDFLLAMSQTSTSRCLEEFCSVVNEYVVNDVIKFPSEAEQRNIKTKFFQNFGFPGVIGLIDGSHILIKSPCKEIEQVYYSVRKSAHSKNVMLVFDSDYKVIALNARYGGSAHDSYVFNSSILKTRLEEAYSAGRRNSWLLGDSGYALQPWLLTPILEPANRAQENYNKAHKTTRAAVERSIGILKSRFRCLCRQRILMYTPEKAGKIINTCAALHNIMILKGYPLPTEDEIAESTDIVDNLDRNNYPLPLENGISIRDEVANNYFS